MVDWCVAISTRKVSAISLAVPLQLTLLCSPIEHRVHTPPWSRRSAILSTCSYCLSVSAVDYSTARGTPGSPGPCLHSNPQETNRQGRTIRSTIITIITITIISTITEMSRLRRFLCSFAKIQRLGRGGASRVSCLHIERAPGPSTRLFLFTREPSPTRRDGGRIELSLLYT